MQPTEKFTGLGMPVFTAFGWAGEETAQNYAYGQLEQFVALLHENLPAGFRAEMPYYGLSAENQSVYLAAEENVEDDVHIVFNARPVSLEVQLALADKAVLVKALRLIKKNPEGFRRLLGHLDADWTFRLQQVQVNEETGERAHYQDIYKGAISDLNEENVVEIFEKAAYLDGDVQWVTPIYLSMRVPADQAAAMQKSIIPVMTERLSLLTPIIAVLRGHSKKQVVAPVIADSEVVPAAEPVVPVEALDQPVRPLSKDEFTYVSELRPLHIDRGFINMTPEYWPFFAINARTESRPVVVIADDIRDEESAVWRLQPTDLARLVLGPQAHRWLEDHFAAGSYIQLVVTRVDDSEIQIVLESIS